MVSFYLDSEKELNNAKSNLKTLNEGWIILNYIGPKTIHFSHNGKNVDEIPNYLDNEKIQHILARIDNKDYCITYVGDKVSTNEKSIKLTLSNNFSNYLQPYDYSYLEGTKSNINKYNISKHY